MEVWQPLFSEEIERQRYAHSVRNSAGPVGQFPELPRLLVRHVLAGRKEVAGHPEFARLHMARHVALHQGLQRD